MRSKLQGTYPPAATRTDLHMSQLLLKNHHHAPPEVMSVIAVHNCYAFCARLRPNRARKPAPGILTGCEPRRRSERTELDTELSRVLLWMGVGVLLALLVLGNSIRDYFFVARILSIQQVRSQVTQRIAALEHDLRVNWTPGPPA